MERMEWDTWVRFLLRFTVDMFFMKMGLKAWEMAWEETERSVIFWNTWKRLWTEESWNYLAFIKALGTDSCVWAVSLNGNNISDYCCLILWISRGRREWIAYLALYCCSLQAVVAVVCLCALMMVSLLGNNVLLVEVLWKERFFVKNRGEIFILIHYVVREKQENIWRKNYSFLVLKVHL